MTSQCFRLAVCLLLATGPTTLAQPSAGAVPAIQPAPNGELWQLGEWVETYQDLFGTRSDWVLSYPLDGPVVGPGLVSGHLHNGAPFTFEVTWYDALPPISDDGTIAYVMGRLITERASVFVNGVLVHANTGGPPSDFFLLWQRIQDPFDGDSVASEDVPCPPVAPCNGIIDAHCVNEACAQFHGRVDTAKAKFQDAIDQAKSDYAKAMHGAAITYSVTLVACLSAVGWWSSLFTGGTSIAACLIGASIVAGREQIKAQTAYQAAYHAAQDTYEKAIDDAISKFYDESKDCCKPYPPPKSDPRKRA